MEKPLSKNEDMKPAGGMEIQCAQYSAILLFAIHVYCW